MDSEVIDQFQNSSNFNITRLPLLAKIIAWVVGIVAVIQLAGVLPTILFVFVLRANISLMVIALLRLLGGGLAFLAAMRLLKTRKNAINFFLAYTMLLLVGAVLQIVSQQNYTDLLIETVVFATATYYVYTLRSRLS